MNILRKIADLFAASGPSMKQQDGNYLRRVPDPEIDAVVAPWRTDPAAVRTRWEIHNRRAREAGCRCGEPATSVSRYPLDGGAVHETWTCAEHVGVESWSGGPDGLWVPRWTRSSPCGSCTGHCGSMSDIGAPRPYKWFCPNKPKPAEVRETAGRNQP